VRKQLFYLTNQELTAYAWHGKDLLRVDGFDNTDAGRLLFGEYLAQAKVVPSYLLVDVVEEDFQRDSAPHVTGASREALIERKLQQLYRDTPFRHAELQGRDKGGRKDDRYLFNALTNAELPKAWLAVMLKHAVALAGMYSVPSLSALLFEKIKPGPGPVLLVSHQSGGLRQSFFDDGQLRFSRLTPLFDHAPAHLLEVFRIETAKTRQFMASTRLLARGAQVAVLVLASAAMLEALGPEMADNADVRYVALESAQAGRLAGLGKFDASGGCDPLFLALLANARVASHFPLREQRHFYQLLQTRALLYGMAGAVALGALAWTAIDVVTTLELRREAVRLQQEAASTEQRYQAIMRDLPRTLVTPHNMKSVVGLEAMLAQHVPLPSEQLAALGAVLAGLPQLKLARLQWDAVPGASVLAAPDPNAAPPEPAPAGDFPPLAEALGVPDKTAQVLHLEGEVLPFSGDYRAALDAVNQLATQLARDPRVQAEVTLQPIDTRVSVRLESKTGVPAGELTAPFAMKVTWKP
jgi:hypothetical protein